VTNTGLSRHNGEAGVEAVAGLSLFPGVNVDPVCGDAARAQIASDRL
jgi:hypothetical protein